MIKSLLITIMFFIAFMTAPTTEANSLTCSSFKMILNGALKKTGFPGISFAARLPGGKIISCTAGVKNIKTKDPVSTQTLFQVGSVTKTFVSTLVLLDVKSGKFALDDTIGDLTNRYGHWLPDKAQKKWKNITVRQLLNMTSGIYSYTDSKEFNKEWRAHPKKYWPVNKILAIAESQKIYFKPGKGWHYSDTNYVILGQLLKHISHKNLSTLIQNKLLSPNNIKNIYYIIDEYSPKILRELARGYGNNYVDRTDINMSQARGAGAIVAQPVELLRWLHTLFSEQIIGHQLLKQMLTPYTLAAGALTHNTKLPAYGLGIFRSYDPKRDGVHWIYGGGTWGYITRYDWSPATNILYVVSWNTGMQFGAKSEAILVHNVFPKLYKVLKIAWVRLQLGQGR